MWLYNYKEIHSHEDLLPECTDIVYLIEYTNGKRYIGMKRVRAVRRLKPTKKQLATRKNYVRKEQVDLPFIDYEGSHKIKDCPEISRKEIIHQCSSKRTATYLEAGCLFEADAIFNPEYLNENISGKFFDNALEGLLEDTNEQYNRSSL